VQLIHHLGGPCRLVCVWVCRRQIILCLLLITHLLCCVAQQGMCGFAQPASAVFGALACVLSCGMFGVYAFCSTVAALWGVSSAPCLVLDSSLISACSVPGTAKC